MPPAVNFVAKASAQRRRPCLSRDRRATGLAKQVRPRLPPHQGAPGKNEQIKVEITSRGRQNFIARPGFSIVQAANGGRELSSSDTLFVDWGRFCNSWIRRLERMKPSIQMHV